VKYVQRHGTPLTGLKALRLPQRDGALMLLPGLWCHLGEYPSCVLEQEPMFALEYSDDMFSIFLAKGNKRDLQVQVVHHHCLN